MFDVPTKTGYLFPVVFETSNFGPHRSLSIDQLHERFSQFASAVLYGGHRTFECDRSSCGCSPGFDHLQKPFIVGNGPFDFDPVFHVRAACLALCVLSKTTKRTPFSAVMDINISRSAMPIYYFEVKRSGQKFTDRDGLSFDNFGDAWEEATVAAGQMVKELDGELVAGTGCSIEVQDEFFYTIRTINISIAGPER